METSVIFLIIWILGAISVVVGGRLYYLHIENNHPPSWETDNKLAELVPLTVFGSIGFPFIVSLLILWGLFKLVDFGIKKLYIGLIK
jgi:hypothetical protein